MSNLVKERIRKKRKELGLTQRDLADKISVSPQVISNWERGYTPEIGNDDLLNLAKALNVSTDYLLGLTNNPQRKEIVTQNHHDPKIAKLLADNGIKKLQLLEGYSLEDIERLVELGNLIRKQKTGE